MDSKLAVQDRILYAKLAEGLEDYAPGLAPADEKLVRRRSRIAAKMTHLSPELALAVSGLISDGLPVYSDPGANVEAVRLLRKATDPKRSKMEGVAYGLPAAAAGALLGQLVSGSPVGAAVGGAAAGGGVGYLAHRGAKKQQAASATRLLEQKQTYDMLREQLAREQYLAQEQYRQAGRMQGKAAELKQAVVRPRYGDLFRLEDFTPAQGKAPAGPSALSMGSAGDSSLGPTDTGRGMLWEDAYNKWAAMTGNQMAPTGVPKPPTPSSGGLGAPAIMGASTAPKLTAPPKAVTPSASMTLPGPVSPNKNKAAGGTPPATMPPSFGSVR